MAQMNKVQSVADRYELQGLAGAHGPVEIYHALDRQLDRPVTVQLLSPKGAEDPETSRAFLRHQQIASSIQACPLLAVYDAGTWRGQPFSVMERDKGAAPDSLYRPGYPPDGGLVLRVTRQVAESLQCCRDAGLSDWTFSPDAVRIDPDGNAFLAIIEGLSGEAISSSPVNDALALNLLMRLMLAGRVDARRDDLVAALTPGYLAAFIERIDPRNSGEVLTAGEVAREVEAAERAALQPTEAYVPGALAEAPTRGPDGATLVLPAVLPISRHDAPTLAAQAIPAPVGRAAGAPPALQIAPASYAHRDTAPLGVQPYTPPEGETAAPVPRKRRLAIPIMILLAVLALLAAVALPRLRGVSTQTAGADSGANTTAPGAMASVPDLRGRSLDEARDLAGAAGLNLSESDALHDKTYPPTTVAIQVPDPGAQVAAGSLLTVSLSLGPPPAPPAQEPPPEGVPAQAAPPPEQQPAAEAQSNPVPPEQSEGKQDKDEKGNKDKNKDKDDD